MANVIIGIGGTGGKVIRALRNRIRQTRGPEGDDNAYLCLDTMHYGYFLTEVYGAMDARELRDIDASGSMSDADLLKYKDRFSGEGGLAIDASEYQQLKGMDRTTLERLLEDPLVDDGRFNWLRADDLRQTFTVPVEVFQFRAGAGQFRQIGRIGAMTTAVDIDRALRKIEKDTRPAQDQGGRGVYIVCSLAGGTGSGNFIDVGVLAGRVFARGGGAGAETSDNINLMLLMDSAFGSADETAARTADDMTVITYATIRELMRFQAAPIPKLEQRFDYPTLNEPIFLKNQTVFDQVCLMDFTDAMVSEDFRRNTVYPTMAEMLDLLTARGTGPSVRMALINTHKEIRMIQARADMDGDRGIRDQTVRDAWANDRFSPYFSTFSSHRLMLPCRAYVRLSAAEATQKFLERLIGREPGEMTQKHLDKACTLVSQSIANLFASLFGEVKPGTFRISDQHTDDNGKAYTPAHAYLAAPGQDRKAQIEGFWNRSAGEIWRDMSSNLSEFIVTNKAESLITADMATRDPQLRANTFRQVDEIRQNQFGLRMLDDLREQDVSLDADGGAQEVLGESIRAQHAAAANDLIGTIRSELDADTGNIRNLLWMLRALEEGFLRAMLDHLHERDSQLLGAWRSAQTTASQCKGNWNRVERKGRECQEAGRDYIAAEQRLFAEVQRFLANRAQLKLVDKIAQTVRHWIGEIEGNITELVSNQPDCAIALASGVANGVHAQLKEWTRSRDVTLGMPGRVAGDEEMLGGFYQAVVGQGLETALNVDATEWHMDNANRQLTFMFDGEATRRGAQAFELLQGRAAVVMETAFRDWTFQRYLWEYVANKDTATMKELIREIAQKFNGVESQVALSDRSRVLTDQYLVMSSPAAETYSNAADFPIMLKDYCASLRMINPTIINDVNASNEITLVRIDAGLDDRNVKKLASARETYVEYIRQNSPILTLTHIFTEEQGLVERERSMLNQLDLGQMQLLPAVLAPIFANRPLTELFISLMFFGFVFVPRAGGADIPSGYLAFLDRGEIETMMSRDLHKAMEFLASLKENERDLRSNFGRLFGLNPPTPRTDPANLLRRHTSDRPDIYTAMARFVSRLPNAATGGGGFPLSMKHVTDLLKTFRRVWARKSSAGGQLYEQLLDRTDRWKEAADDIEGFTEAEWEQPDLRDGRIDDLELKAGCYLHSAPLTKFEAQAFMRQLAMFGEAYSRAMKPPSEIDEGIIVKL